MPVEARAGVWGCGRPSSGCPSAMVPHSLGRPHFLHGFSWRGDPHSHPLCGICTTDSGPLPGSALLTPQFSTQPLPAWVASCLRQERSGLWLWHGWHSGPQSLCGWRSPWFWQWVSLLRWCSSRCWQRPELAAGEGGCSTGPGPSVSLHNGTLLLYCPGLQKIPQCGTPYPFPSGCLFTNNSHPLPGSALQILAQHPAQFCTGRHTEQSRVHRAAAWTMYQFLLCSAFHRLVPVSIDPCRCVSVPAGFPIMDFFFFFPECRHVSTFGFSVLSLSQY